MIFQQTLLTISEQRTAISEQRLANSEQRTTKHQQPTTKKFTINKQQTIIKQIQGFLSTPPLWEGVQFGVPQFQFPEVMIAGFVPSPIPEKLRLGHRMEYVCKQLLDASAQYEVLLHNLPIREEKLTIGEIDFIVQETATQQLIHVELTYKFYIIDTEIKEPIHQLIGPNRRDAFYTKLEKIKNNQFSLLHTPVGRSVLLEKGIDTESIAQQVCYKAQLFKPYNSAPLPINPLNPNCIVGFWLRMAEFLTADFTPHHFYIPTKSEWVVDPENDVKWLTHQEVTIAITERLENKSAPMVWMKKKKTTFEKFFIVWW